MKRELFSEVDKEGRLTGEGKVSGPCRLARCLQRPQGLANGGCSPFLLCYVVGAGEPRDANNAGFNDKIL